jgi:hypothetical protein
LSIRASQAGLNDIELYLYPPLLADLLAPFSHASPHLAAAIWRFLNLVVAFSACLVIGIDWISSSFTLLLLAFYSYWPVNEAIVVGQISVFILLLWAVAISAYAKNSIVLSAFALAFATALKVSPIVALPVFAVLHEWRWVRWYCLFISLFLVLMGVVNGWHNLAVYADVTNALNQGSPTLQNKSINSLVAWIANGQLFSLDGSATFPRQSDRLVFLSKALGAAFYLFCLFRVWRGRKSYSMTRTIEVVATFAIVSCLISPVSWRHGYCVALLPLAILWADCLRSPRSRLDTCLLTAATLITGSLFLDLATRAHLPHGIAILAGASWTLSCLLLVIGVLRPPSILRHLRPAKLELTEC